VSGVLIVMPAKGQIDIRVKFQGIPLANHDSRGSSKIEVTCDSYVVIATVKTKTYHRFVLSARSFHDWEGLLSGKLHHIQGHQLMLVNGGLQCYEKKNSASNALSG
jgi:hypothetical protein